MVVRQVVLAQLAGRRFWLLECAPDAATQSQYRLSDATRSMPICCRNKTHTVDNPNRDVKNGFISNGSFGQNHSYLCGTPRNPGVGWTIVYLAACLVEKQAFIQSLSLPACSFSSVSESGSESDSESTSSSLSCSSCKLQAKVRGMNVPCASSSAISSTSARE